MRDSQMMITVPAKLLYELVALANGYTMSHGNFISKSSIKEADQILYEAGYEYGLDNERLI